MNKRQQIYTKAAELIESGKALYACHAIQLAKEGDITPGYINLPEVKFLQEMFSNPDHWGSVIWFDYELGEETCKTCRIIALTLCAEMCND